MRLLVAILAEIKLFFTKPSWLSEVASGMTTLTWGVLAITDARFGTQTWPSTDLFMRISEGPVWGCVGLIIGVGQMGLFSAIDRNWRKPWLRWGAAIIAAWLWGAITLSATRFVPWPPGVAAYAGWWAVNVYLIFRMFWTRG